MKILLINSNPVVSRLTALSARKEEIQIDEVQEINEVNNNQYDIVFVDSDSWSKEVDSAISKDIQAQKRVLFYGQDDDNDEEFFDVTILKPFLPSEVSTIIRSVEKKSLFEENSVEEAVFNPTKSSKEENKEDFLFSLDDKVVEKESKKETEEDLFAELKESKKEKEEDLFAELKESKKENKKLNDAFPIKSDEELFNLEFSDDIMDKEFELLDKKSEKEKGTEKEELFDFDFNLEEDKKSDSLENLELNLDGLTKDKKDKEFEVTKSKEHEIPKEIEVKKEEPLMIKKLNPEEKIGMNETQKIEPLKTLDITDILENDNDLSVDFEELLPPLSKEKMEIKEKVEVKKVEVKKEEQKEEKIREQVSFEDETVMETISSLPVDRLKVLLAGATIKISIKFPKDK